LIVSWQKIFIFCCPPQFSQDIGKWPQNQILILDWTYFHCPGTTLVLILSVKFINCRKKQQQVEVNQRQEAAELAWFESSQKELNHAEHQLQVGPLKSLTHLIR